MFSLVILVIAYRSLQCPQQTAQQPMFHGVRLRAFQVSDTKFKPRITTLTKILPLSVQSQRPEAVWSVDVGISLGLAMKTKSQKAKRKSSSIKQCRLISC